MDILIRNCNLISMSEDRPEYEEEVSIYIENRENYRNRRRCYTKTRSKNN